MDGVADPSICSGHTGACYVTDSAVKLGQVKLTQLFSMLWQMAGCMLWTT